MIGRSRSLAIKMSAAGIIFVLAGIITWGASESSRAADLAEENSGLRSELVGTQDALQEALDKLDALSDRIELLERVVRDAGLEVPPPVTVVVEDRRDGGSTTTTTRPPSTTTSTTRPPTTTTTEPCTITVRGACIGG